MISSRTPEGSPLHCPICGERTAIEPSLQGDACCPSCGNLLGWFGNKLGLPAISPDLEWAADLGFDSIETVELAMQLEEEFELTISDEDADQIRTIADAIRYIRRHGRFRRP
ncbi:phosphopantetheine-binding protein [Anatilimnocola floriformis]|uniref:phosphopantetheine-binding protein n=1 Tax=Anatilimnocola floriformis TaxID=2948575 RepID=UPI0028F45A81|nr:phosphopantetheine-binding protein [Anatilimnocola floriformis]